MNKICTICNKAKVVSIYNTCCKNCKMDIVRSLNCTILIEKNNINKFFSEKKSKTNEKDYYYNKEIFYIKIKESNKFLNAVINNYSNSIKFRDGILKYIDYSNEQMKKIDEVMKKRGKRQLV